MNPRVINVKPNPNYTLKIQFSNGEIKMFDVKPYLEIGMFKELKEQNLFNTVKPNFWKIVKEKNILKFFNY